jgi:exopolyphosphatase/guanosine-5'-triphosphate,3'-diphosphate pyrophosphatase
VAAIDCGTNSTRLLVVDGTGEPLRRLMRITRLGQGVDATHALDADALGRTLAVLAEFRREMDALGVARTRLVATSAVRDAANGQEFLDAATAAVGAPAEMLSGEEEGRLAYAGATADLDPSVDAVVVDIGGGSTELIVGGPGEVHAVSLELGCVRLTERYLAHDPPSGEELARATAAIGAELDRARAALPALDDGALGRRLVGLAGTVSTLSALEQGMAEYDRERIHHSVLTLPRVEHWCAVLAAEPASARASRAGMAPGRQDVIVGGALVLREVMARFDFTECLVSESDILDGLVATVRR